MTGPDQLHHPGGHVGLGVGTGGEAVGVELVEEHGRPRHDRGRAVPLGRVGAQHDTELPHDGRRVRVVSLHVADDRTDPAAGQGDDVVPVAADVPPEPCGAVADGDLGPWHVGDPARQHRLLESFGEIVLLLVEHGPLEALGDRAAESHQEVALVTGEARLVAVQEPERADRPGLGDERHVGGGGDAEVTDVRPQQGVRRREVLGRLDEPWRERTDHLAHRIGLVRPGVAGALHERPLGTVRHQMDAPRLQQPHDETGGTEVGQAPGALQHLRDVLDRTGVGEGSRGALDQAGTAPALLVDGAAGGGLGQFLGGVTDDPDDAARPPGAVAADEPLGVGPAEGAVPP